MKRSKIINKLEEFSYQINAKKGNTPVILKSINELDKSLEKIANDRKDKKK
ncbi:hypothetical protein INP51_00405 [Blautia liquoris]|jgi:hypothetical protein|uniref:Uncharacterized protein n=1 Tax=Blautia liquoris TaxID=2779518 RepID=A0A7M2RJF5_9FIRM|nr:hypothetical protein [Blautia liquoris]QOV19482.1 hypothetical protein INP51_00405 [Blautia liquoris]